MDGFAPGAYSLTFIQFDSMEGKKWLEFFGKEEGALPWEHVAQTRIQACLSRGGE